MEDEMMGAGWIIFLVWHVLSDRKEYHSFWQVNIVNHVKIKYVCYWSQLMLQQETWIVQEVYFCETFRWSTNLMGETNIK